MTDNLLVCRQSENRRQRRNVNAVFRGRDSSDISFGAVLISRQGVSQESHELLDTSTLQI